MAKLDFGKIAKDALSAGAGGIGAGIIDSILPQLSSNGKTNQIIKSLAISGVGAFLQTQKDDSMKYLGAGMIGVSFERLFQKGFGFNFRVGQGFYNDDATKLLISEDEMNNARANTNALALENAMNELDANLQAISVNSDDSNAFQVAMSPGEKNALAQLEQIANLM